MAWVQPVSWGQGDKRKTGFQVRETDPRTGKKRVLKTFATRREAKKFLTSGDASPDKIMPGDIAKVTVGEAAQLWLRAREKGSDGEKPCGRATLANYTSVVAAHLAPEIGALRVVEFRAADARAFRATVLEKVGRVRARDVVNRARQIFEWHIVQNDLSLRNPFQGVLVVVDDDNRPERRLPTHEELETLLRRVVELQHAPLADARERQSWRRYAPMVWLVALVAARISEVFAADWRDIDLDAGVWEIRRTADKFGALKRPKTRAGNRALKLPQALIPLLRAWRQDCPPTEDHLVFPTAAGRPIDYRNFATSAWLRLMTSCGYLNAKGAPLFTVYALRHFKLSDDIARGDDIKTVQARSGHARADTLLNVYARAFKARAATAETASAERLSHDMKLGPSVVRWGEKRGEKAS